MFADELELLNIPRTGYSNSIVYLHAGWNLFGSAENCRVPEDVDAVYSWHEGRYQNMNESGRLLIEIQAYWMFVIEPKEVDLARLFYYEILLDDKPPLPLKYLH